MSTMNSIIERVRFNRLGELDWLYIVGSANDLTLETEADLGQPESDDEFGNEIAPPGFADRGLYSTIDIETLKDCINWADYLAGSHDDNAALDIIRYYLRFDSTPKTLNSADPPPHHVIQRQADRVFCDKLGPEDSSRQCRRDGCERGAIDQSVLCRRHHFESIRKRPYPFED